MNVCVCVRVRACTYVCIYITEPSSHRWLRTKRTSPLTGLDLPSTNLLPNIPLRKMCADWRQRLAS